uniref:SHSP domain-containing protein n=1 Tax=Acrobeloides nanus TaxID=290746 RepID=A0A914C1J6_9BILA
MGIDSKSLDSESRGDERLTKRKRHVPTAEEGNPQTWGEMFKAWPKTTLCIVSNECCERFSYYGMRILNDWNSKSAVKIINKKRGMKPKYDFQLKLATIAYCKQTSIAQAAKRFGVSQSSIINWRNQGHELMKQAYSENSQPSNKFDENPYLVEDRDSDDQENMSNASNSVFIHANTEVSNKSTKNYGAAKFVRSSRHGLDLVYDSHIYPNHRFRFREAGSYPSQKMTVYKCLGCLRVNRKQEVSLEVPLIKVQENMILDNPDELNHFCIHESLGEKGLDASEEAPYYDNRALSSISAESHDATTSQLTNNSSNENRDISNSNEEHDFSYPINVADYIEEEINIDIDKEYVIVQAEHNVKDDIAEVRTTYKIRIPSNIDRSSIEATFDGNDQLVITGKKMFEKRSLSINRKHSL